MDGKTKVYGVMGDPIEHSMSPLMHNFYAERTGTDLVYVPFHVNRGTVEMAVKGAFALNIQGMNVTVPHKQDVIKCLEAIDEDAKAIGAVNTLVRTEHGYKGYNTDGAGLKRAMDEAGISIAGEKCILIGAGHNAACCPEIGDIALCVGELRINDVLTVRVQLERLGVRGKVSFCASGLREVLIGDQIANLHRLTAGFRSGDGYSLLRVVKPCGIVAFEAIPYGVLTFNLNFTIRIPGRRPLRRQRDALYAFISRKRPIGGSGKHGFAGTAPAAELIVGSGGRLHTVQHALLPPDAGFIADTRAAGSIKLYGVRGLLVSADGEIVLDLAAVVPRAVQRHLGGFFRVKARIVRVKGVGIYIVGIGGGVVRVLRKLLRFVLTRLMGKPRQLLFAAVIGAVRQPLHRQKPLLIAISNIILAAERAFAVCVKAMVNARSVDGAAADGDVFRWITRQLLCVQVVIDIIGIVHVPTFRMPEGFHRAVHDLNIGIQGRLVADSDAGNIFGIIRKQPAAFCGHGAVFNKDPQRSISAGT